MSKNPPVAPYADKLPHYLNRPVHVRGEEYRDVLAAASVLDLSIKETLRALYAHAIPDVYFAQSLPKK